MVRLLMYLFGKGDYEPCKGCEVLKQQLAIANAEKKEAIDTVIDIIKPKGVTPVELKPTAPVAGVFSRRQAFLEQQDRANARAMRSDFIAAKDRIKVDPGAIKEATEEIEKLVNEEEGNASKVG